ncbi:MAG: NAD(P)H-dependent oxidoreductase [Gemmobacter sp.]
MWVCSCRPAATLDSRDESLTGFVQQSLIVLQFPLFWYSCPALLKEWIDLTFEHGFAYGEGGDRLHGKVLHLAVTTSGSSGAYTPGGHNHLDIRTFLTPFEQTARLSGMRFAAPYLLHGALRADPAPHAAGFARLLAAWAAGRMGEDAFARPILTHDTLLITEG